MQKILIGIGTWIFFLFVMFALFGSHNDGAIDTLFLKFLLGVAIVTTIGTIVPLTFQEVGSYVGFYLKQHQLANILLTIGNWLNSRQIWITMPIRSYAAIDAARVAVLKNDFALAKQWIQTALSVVQNEQYFSQFRAKVVAGQIRFLQGDFERAKDYLHEALELHDKNVEVFRARDQSLADFKACTLDMLGQIALAEGDLRLANAYYELGIRLRQTIRLERRVDQAYLLNWLALKSLFIGDVTQAENSALEAAENLKPGIILFHDREVYIAVARTLRTIKSEVCLAAANSIESALGGLHPLERELLNKIIPIGIPEHPSILTPTVENTTGESDFENDPGTIINCAVKQKERIRES